MSPSSTALGGVVQLVTRRGGGDGTHLGDARLEGGSNDYLRGGVAAGRRFGALAVDLSGHLRRGEGEVANDFYDGEEIAQAIHQRSDVCAVPAAGVVAEAMVALVLADCLLEKFGGDSVAETARNVQAYLAAIPEGMRTW